MAEGRDGGQVGGTSGASSLGGGGSGGSLLPDSAAADSAIDATAGSAGHGAGNGGTAGSSGGATGGSVRRDGRQRRRDGRQRRRGRAAAEVRVASLLIVQVSRRNSGFEPLYCNRYEVRGSVHQGARMCVMYCAAAGLKCKAKFGGEPGCMKEPANPKVCGVPTGHQSDWCECGY